MACWANGCIYLNTYRGGGQRGWKRFINVIQLVCELEGERPVDIAGNTKLRLSRNSVLSHNSSPFHAYGTPYNDAFLTSSTYLLLPFNLGSQKKNLFFFLPAHIYLYVVFSQIGNGYFLSDFQCCLVYTKSVQ